MEAEVRRRPVAVGLGLARRRRVPAPPVRVVRPPALGQAVLVVATAALPPAAFHVVAFYADTARDVPAGVPLTTAARRDHVAVAVHQGAACVAVGVVGAVADVGQVAVTEVRPFPDRGPTAASRPVPYIKSDGQAVRARPVSEAGVPGVQAGRAA